MISVVFGTISVFAEKNTPKLSAVSAILIDMQSGQVLYEKEAGKKMYPASTTKIVSYLVIADAIKNGELGLNDKLTFTREMQDAMDPTGSHIELRAGEEMSVDNLIRAMLIASGNDAATLLAVTVGKDEAGFVKKMNEKASSVGAKNTHFSNAHGLTDENHYTTAKDLSLFAKTAMKDEFFREVVSSKTLTIPPTNLKSEERYYINTNNLISPLRYSKYYYPKATGIKTGYTEAAGSCLVASAKDKERELICVVLKSETSHEDAKALLEYGFNNFKQVKIAESKDILGEVKVKQASNGNDHVRAVAKEDAYATLPLDADIDKITSKTVYDSTELYAPVALGSKLGTVTYFHDGKEIGSVEIVAEKEIERHTFGFLMSFWEAVWGCTVIRIILYLILIFILLFILLVIYGFYRSLKQSRARKRRRAKYRPPMY